MANTCNSKNVPDNVLTDQISRLDQLHEDCKEAGGTLTTRVIYGCGNDNFSEYKGSSPATKYTSPSDYLDPNSPGPDLGQGQADEAYREEITRRVKAQQQEALRIALEQAEKAAKTNCREGAAPAFAVQAFCKNGNNAAPPNTVLPPFIAQK